HPLSLHDALPISFSPRTRPITRPLTTMSSATISPRMVALSPTVSRWARMSPSTVPSTWMSPVVRRLPTTVRSEDRIEVTALPLGAVGVKSIEGFVTGASGALGVCPSAWLGPGSLMRLLENIAGCLYELHRIDGGAADPDFVVEMGAGGPA